MAKRQINFFFFFFKNTIIIIYKNKFKISFFWLVMVHAFN